MLEVGKNVRNIWVYNVGIIWFRIEKVSNVRKVWKRGKRKRERVEEKRKGKKRMVEEREIIIVVWIRNEKV